MSDKSSQRSEFSIGTRKSKLALIQVDLIIQALQKTFPHYKFTVDSRDTAGDRNKVTPLSQFGGKNLWTEELEQLLVDREIDFVVHSLKDVPTLIPESCALASSPLREDPRDVLVVKKGLPYKSLDDLPAGSVVGTSSVRRTALLARHYPHLKVENVRGNIETRLNKCDSNELPYTAIIVAAAGLLRTGFADRITQYLDSKNGKMYHAVGQGALGIEIRADDAQMREMFDVMGDLKTTYASLAERNLLRTLEGGCSAPLGVETEWVANESGSGEVLRLRSIVCSVDGKEAVEVEMDKAVASKEQAEQFGYEVAEELRKKGAGKILEEIAQSKKPW
ncbi:Tetrapyrrole biosynthesis, hydroxymethylbilane synthase [Ascosphaera apis ARSEF 7405]|uniref:Porphobilinogen deaminase n=1 Tax=Ascosphaera apis ARSEF 7405 TaxID=392613 RepID=A0A167X240_9EURO|nr:Tetrapyrrole biosynthesis, hydroxymethylbilane synthase [Ascosphaera apis ARSEF 7405]